uniref:hypothetical protein n=1 Tax=Salmonella sp. s51090 TaxID=3159651 RepID=UPI00397F3215
KIFNDFEQINQFPAWESDIPTNAKSLRRDLFHFQVNYWKTGDFEDDYARIEVELRFIPSS